MSTTHDPAPHSTPDAEWPIDAALVRTLLLEQHPDLATLEVEPFESGWDNALFRLGADFIVRLPRRRIAAELLEHEQRWLPTIAPRLPLPIPVPLRTGEASTHFPWPWSLVRNLPGVCADEAGVAAHEAQRLADFLLALHVSAPPDAPRNPVRGVPLAQRAETIEARLSRLAGKTTHLMAQPKTAWVAGLAASSGNRATWVHGDLHARNVLVNEKRLSAVIDWGDVCQGDCATDLAAIWMLLPNRRAREVALARYAPDEALLRRGRAWAVAFGAILLETGLVDHPRHAAMGSVTLRNVGDGP